MQNKSDASSELQKNTRPKPDRIMPKPDQLDIVKAESKPEKSVSHDDHQLRGVYIISVAARILEMHPQTLRKYERLGLIRPSRTLGMLRLYSQHDIEKIRLIKHLEENLGLNLAGVELMLDLLARLVEMRRRLSGVDAMERIFDVMEQEMDRLVEKLNLNVED